MKTAVAVVDATRHEASSAALDYSSASNKQYRLESAAAAVL